MEIVFATHNEGKRREIHSLLTGIKIRSLNDIGCFQDIEEIGSTLKENAMIKTNFIADRYNYNAFADDTGLFVRTLNGAPGVFSARYAGKGQNSEKNIALLLDHLDDKNDRFAYFETVICLNLYRKNFFFTGRCQGSILKEARGHNGFSYDSIFKPDGSNRSFAEMEPSEKNEYSHRRLAIEKMIAFFKTKKK